MNTKDGTTKQEDELLLRMLRKLKIVFPNED